MLCIGKDRIRICNPIKLKVVTMYYPKVESFRDVVSVADSRDWFIAVAPRVLLDCGSVDPEGRRAAVLDTGSDCIAARFLEIGAVASPESS